MTMCTMSLKMMPSYFSNAILLACMAHETKEGDQDDRDYEDAEHYAEQKTKDHKNRNDRAFKGCGGIA